MDSIHTEDGADGHTVNLDAMLALADRELHFLRDHFDARSDVSQSATGAEFIEALDIAMLALTRLRLEREAQPSSHADDRALYDAIAILKRDEP